MTRRRSFSHFRIAAAALAAIAATGCPSPITRDVLLQAKDAVKPVVAISSPLEGSPCANIVEVRGTATDASTDAGDAGSVRTLSYSVGGSTVSGDVQVGADGAFVFQFSTVTLANNFALTVTAVDWNGNAGTASLNLCRQSGSAIPSFTAAPGNHQVTLTWNPVPHTASYALRYTTNGSLPSSGVGQELTGVTSPLVLTNLANENMHVFQLITVPETGWPESLSDYMRAIPLSAQSLAPKVFGEYGRIRVEWPIIPATDEFEVWRSTEENGAYFNLSGEVTGNSYTDVSVSDGIWYWYKVRPTLEGSALSYANGAQTDIFQPAAMPVIASYQTTRGQGIAVSGSYAYVADYTSGLRIFDISNPASPVQTGICFTTQAAAVAVSYPYAYIADTNSGLRIIDVSNPAAPFIRGSYSLTAANGVAVSGSYAYVTSNMNTDRGLNIIDVSTPASPVRRSLCVTSEATSVSLLGSYAYVTDGSSGLRVISVSNPLSPSIVTTVSTGGNARSATINGSTLYVAAGSAGLLIYSLSTPSSPSFLGSFAATYPVGVAVSGANAYVADTANGLRFVSVANPASPILIGTAAAGGNVQGVAVSGIHAFVADYYLGLRVIEARAPSAPAIKGTLTLGSQPTDISIRDSYVYMADAVGRFRVIDISSPATPVQVGLLSTNQGLGVAVSGPYAYVADQNTGIRIIDITNPSAPFIRNTFDVHGSAFDIEINGSYAFVADRNFGLRIIDISDPASPLSKGVCPAAFALGVAVSGSYAYVVAGSGGGSPSLRIIGVSNPASPLPLGSIALTNPQNVAVCYPYAYVADEASGLRVIDISDPLDPRLITTFGIAGSSQGVKISGSYAYVADSTAGIRIIDITNPASPRLISTCSGMSFAMNLTVRGAYAYVVDNGGYVYVIELAQ